MVYSIARILETSAVVLDLEGFKSVKLQDVNWLVVSNHSKDIFQVMFETTSQDMSTKKETTTTHHFLPSQFFKTSPAHLALAPTLSWATQQSYFLRNRLAPEQTSGSHQEEEPVVGQLKFPPQKKHGMRF